MSIEKFNGINIEQAFNQVAESIHDLTQDEFDSVLATLGISSDAIQQQHIGAIAGQVQADRKKASSALSKRVASSVAAPAAEQIKTKKRKKTTEVREDFIHASTADQMLAQYTAENGGKLSEAYQQGYEVFAKKMTTAYITDLTGMISAAALLEAEANETADEVLPDDVQALKDGWMSKFGL